MNKPATLNITALQRGAIHLIEANAGTGKTYAIANLCLRFVLEGVAVRELLVVTFTRAATDELRGRIRARLEAGRRLLAAGRPGDTGDAFFDGLTARHPEGPERETALLRLEVALHDIHEAPIHTIHGFCQQALADQAFASGQPFELEQHDDTALREQVLRDWWRSQTYETDPEALDQFLTAVGSFTTLQEHLRTLLQPAGPELNPPPPDDQALSSLEQAARTALCRLAALWRTHGEETKKLLLTHPELDRRCRHQRPARLEEAFSTLDQALLRERPTFPDPERLVAISREARVFKKDARRRQDFDTPLFRQADILRARLEELPRARTLHALDQARRYTRQRLQGLKSRRGWLAFDDMIERLHAALHRGDAQSGPLAVALARRHPVILVDEFQDTDPLQYAIFSNIHRAARHDGHTLILIGDPKQAIYGFRGGDIFTYMQARREADRLWNLAVNWRSTPEMIEAVNHLFSGDRPFVYEDLPYRPSQPPPRALRRARPLLSGGRQIRPLIVEGIPTGEHGKPLSKDQAYAWVHATVAGRIAELLSDPQVRLGDRRLAPGDIAVLVRTRREGVELRQRLLEHGIRSVSMGGEPVWTTAEAEGLRLALEAALLPEDRTLARQALTSPLLALEPAALHAIITDPHRWTAWVEQLHGVHERWRRRGFMAAFHALLDGFAALWDPQGRPDPAAWLARLTDPERTLTNLLHLAELLQEAAREQAGGEALLAWMRQQQERAAQEEHLLRLESDENLVKIATMHAAKGLQYPVVFVPYLWHCRPVNPKNGHTLKWHEARDDGGYTHHYRPWHDPGDPHLPLADRERLAEDVRLVYVALTRAESHCHVVFGPAGDKSRPGHAGNTAFAWLLSPRDAPLHEKPFEGEIDFKGLKDSAQIELRPPGQPQQPDRVPPPPAGGGTLAAATLDRTIRTDWRIASFTALTRDVHQATRVAPAADVQDFALAYPAGARVGSFLHALLERIDPRQNLQTQLRDLIPRLALRHGLPPEQDPCGLAGWLHDVFNTPLNEGGPTLAALPPERRLHELSFDFATARVDCAALDAALRAAWPRPDALPPLRFDTFQGMVNGIIDLVFEHEGRYYLADYKSNLLGRTLDDYAPDRLAAEVAARRYDLQYALYTLALHRHLRLRLADYDYERHFGGVFYLFLRGMRPAHGPRRGVHFTRPAASLIERLDVELFARGAPLP